MSEEYKNNKYVMERDPSKELKFSQAKTEDIASLEGCIRESTNKIVAALLYASMQSSDDNYVKRYLECYQNVLKELEGGK